MTWVRIDETRQGEFKQPQLRPGLRVYGLNGKLWPRLTLSVTLEPYPRDGTASLLISCSRKEATGFWWVEAQIPLELLPDLRELLAGDIPDYTHTEPVLEDGEVE